MLSPRSCSSTPSGSGCDRRAASALTKRSAYRRTVRRPRVLLVCARLAACLLPQQRQGCGLDRLVEEGYIGFVLLGKMELEDGVEAVQQTTQLQDVLRCRSIRRQLRNEGAVASRQVRDLHMGSDPWACGIV